MANYTPNYQLHQWEPQDPFLRIDFNQDLQKIDEILGNLTAESTALQEAIKSCGNCNIFTASYVGTGKSGKTNPNTLTFTTQPLFVYISCPSAVYFAAEFYGSKFINMRAGSGAANCPATWAGNTVSWYHENNCTNQLNDRDVVYQVMAFVPVGE